MDTNDKKKFNYMENVLIKIYEKVISLPEKEKKINSVVLDKVTETMLNLMKQKDLLFATMYERNFYGGSYYDKLKVGNPEEFDIDLLLKLPLVSEPQLTCTEKHGFVQIKITEYLKLMKRPEANKYAKFSNILDAEDFLSTKNVLRWMEGLMSKVFSQLKKDENNNSYIDINGDKSRIYVKVKKGGPAFTLAVNGTYQNQNICFDVDFVPCFCFDKQWPQEGFRKNTSDLRKTFFIVPKAPREYNTENKAILERYWRLSFQEQERELISGNEMKCLKPALKLVKKLRDHHNDKPISSYFIKTIFLWEITNPENKDLWKSPLSFTYMTMLEKYQTCLENGEIPYFWNRNFNLIAHINKYTLSGIAKRIRKLINLIEMNTNDPFIVCMHFMEDKDIEIIRKEVVLGKKALNRSILQLSELQHNGFPGVVKQTSTNVNENLVQDQLEINQLHIEAHAIKQEIPENSVKSDIQENIFEQMVDNFRLRQKPMTNEQEMLEQEIVNLRKSQDQVDSKVKKLDEKYDKMQKQQNQFDDQEIQLQKSFDNMQKWQKRIDAQQIWLEEKFEKMQKWQEKVDNQEKILQARFEQLFALLKPIEYNERTLQAINDQLLRLRKEDQITIETLKSRIDKLERNVTVLENENHSLQQKERICICKEC